MDSNIIIAVIIILGGNGESYYYEGSDLDLNETGIFFPCGSEMV